MLSPYIVGTVLNLFSVIDFLARSVAFTLTAFDSLTLNRHDHIRPVYQSVFLFCVAPAPLLSAALSFWRLRQHKTSGRYNEKLALTLRFLTGSNAFVALYQLCGGLVLCFLFFTGNNSHAHVRQGVLLVSHELPTSHNR
jgi:hypothetical protein